MNRHSDTGGQVRDPSDGSTTVVAPDSSCTGGPDVLAPCIYIVTACRNSERTIGDTLQSVVTQLRAVAGHVIVDGASTDGTLDVIDRFAPIYGPKLTVISEPDSGIYNAMNKGVTRCLSVAEPGDLIATLNSDDRYEPGALTAVVSAAQCQPGVDLFYGDLAVLDLAGRPTGRVRQSVQELTRGSASDGMPIEHPTSFIRARAYRKFGLYDESYAIAGDYELVLRMVSGGLVSKHIGTTLTGFRYGGVSTTQESASFKEAIRARIAHGANPLFEWARYGKRRAFGRLFRIVSWIPGVRRMQARYGASVRNAGQPK